MKRFFTSVLASLCVLAAMAVTTREGDVKTYAEIQKVGKIGETMKMAMKANTPFKVASASATDGFTKLGIGTLTDNFFDGSVSVEIWKSSTYTNYFRVMDPYKGVYNNGGTSYAGSEYMDLIIIPVGSSWGDVSVTQSGLVYFSDCNTGVYFSSYGYVLALHPSRFSDLQDESYWTYSKVVSYQSDGKTPTEVLLAPIYYIEDAGVLYNSSQTEGKVSITFPTSSIPVTNITLNKTTATLTSGSTLQLDPTVLPTNATNKTVSWTTSNSSVATVSSNGLVTAKTVTTQSTATITCSATDGSGVKATCTVTVTPSVIPVQSITLSQTSASLNVGNTLQLSATVLPTNATNKTVSWTTSNSSVATVSSSGLVTAKTVTSQSTATITCSATDGSGVKATCTVTVTPSVISVQSITLSQTSASLSVGNTLQLSATVLPTNATNKTVSWTTSSSSVATVSSTGLITAISNGTATITCSATDGSGVKATCTVTVSGGYPEPSISAVTCENSSLTQNDELKMTATFYNYGVGGNVKTVPVVMAKDDDLTLIEVGGIVSNYFPASQSTTLSYSLSMTEVPEGEYYASVLFYVESDDEDEEGWYYSSKCLVEITVGPDDCNLKGDVNGDCIVNGTDLVALTNIILGRSATKPAADVNQDGSVNGTDYVVLANIILGRSNARGLDYSTAAGDFAGTSWIEVEPYEISAGQEKEVTIDLFNPDDEITLVQFDLDLPQGLNLKVVDGDYDIDIAGRTTWKNHSLSANATDGIIRFLLASSNNKALSGTEGAIITMTLVADDSYKGEGFALKNILLVTPEEKETKPEDIIPVGIRDIVASTEQSHATIYSISGQRLATPHKGVNILDGKKIVVR